VLFFPLPTFLHQAVQNSSSFAHPPPLIFQLPLELMQPLSSASPCLLSPAFPSLCKRTPLDSP
jgi:hypothetical protein